MKNSAKFLLVLILIIINQSCNTENIEDIKVLDLKGNLKGNEILIPDDNFRSTLINTNCVDTNYDGIPDTNVDFNNDGQIQKNEANSIEVLIIDFDYGTPIRFVDLEGIEHFSNLKRLEVSGTGGSVYNDQVLNEENLNYDFSKLRKLEYVKLDHFGADYFDNFNFSGLTKLSELDLSGIRPIDYNSDYYNQFININLDGCSNLKKLNMTNSFLRVDFCQIPSLEVLDMFYLEGGEPDTFDFHCLENLKWLNIGENMISTLILKNSSVLETFLTDGIGSSGVNPIYPYPQYICIDNTPEEIEQIFPIVNENTSVVFDCQF